MNTVSPSMAQKPYNLELVVHHKYDLTAEKIAQLEADLIRGNVQPLVHILEKLPATVTSFLPSMGSIRFDEGCVIEGIYETLPAEMVKWILFHIEKNLHCLTQSQCQTLHQSFCASHLFSGNQPNPLAFSLASSVFRTAQSIGGTSVSDEALDPQVIVSFINHCRIPDYNSFAQAAMLIKTFKYWNLGDPARNVLNEEQSMERCMGADVNHTWSEMLTAFEYDPDTLACLKERFCNRFVSLCSHLTMNFQVKEGVRALPIHMFHVICNGGAFYDYLLASANAINLLSFQSSSIFMLKLLKVSHSSLLSKYKTVVAECELLNPFIRFLDCSPWVDQVYLYPSPTVHLCNYTNLLDRGIHITFAKVRFCYGRFTLEVGDTALLSKVTFESPGEVRIRAKRVTACVSIPGWMTQTYREEGQYEICFSRS